MNVKLFISPARYIYELQHEFNHAFPFLRLEFYRIHRIEVAGEAVQPVTQTSLLRSIGVKEAGFLEINEYTTVAELEAQLKQGFGLLAKVVRLSGNIWLETSMTNDWTLVHQNEHGRELSNSFLQHKSPAEEAGLFRNLPDQ